jgi:hypothetical protein
MGTNSGIRVRFWLCFFMSSWMVNFLPSNWSLFRKQFVLPLELPLFRPVFRFWRLFSRYVRKLSVITIIEVWIFLSLWETKTFLPSKASSKYWMTVSWFESCLQLNTSVFHRWKILLLCSWFHCLNSFFPVWAAFVDWTLIILKFSVIFAFNISMSFFEMLFEVFLWVFRWPFVEPCAYSTH